MIRYVSMLRCKLHYPFDVLLKTKFSISDASIFCSDPRTRFVDPFLFTPDVCRIHWSYHDFLKRKAIESIAASPSHTYAAKENLKPEYKNDADSKEKQSPNITNEGSDSESMLTKLDKLVGHVSEILSKDQTQPKETPTLAELQAQCESESIEKKKTQPPSEEAKIESNGMPRSSMSGKSKKIEKENEPAEASSRAAAVEMRRKAREERRRQQRHQRESLTSNHGST
eukprot:jgi/Bigna1/71867/fgenesh1_pg.17_\